MVRTFVAALCLASAPAAALGCTLPLPDQAVKVWAELAAKADKDRTSLVEVVVVRPAKWPGAGALRVTKVYWGKLQVEAIIAVQPQPGSTCGPGSIAAGERGLVELSNDRLQHTPVPFYGFMDAFQLNAYRARGLIGP